MSGSSKLDFNEFFSNNSGNPINFASGNPVESFRPLGVALKSYLRYKMIISQNVSSEAQVKNLVCRKVIFRSKDIQDFAFFTISSFTKFVTP